MGYYSNDYTIKNQLKTIINKKIPSTEKILLNELNTLLDKIYNSNVKIFTKELQTKELTNIIAKHITKPINPWEFILLSNVLRIPNKQLRKMFVAI